jgi:PEP-CTERM motif
MSHHRAFTLTLPVILFFGLAIAPEAKADSISIVNAGFEDPVLAPANYTDGSAPGWNVVGAGGVLNPSPDMFSGGAPEGQNVGWSNGGYLSQTLSDVLKFGTYSLMVDVGDRLDLPFGNYSVQLKAGSVVLAEDNNTLLPSNGTFLTSIVTYDATAGSPDIGQALTIVLNVNGIQTNFDDVRLNFTPSISGVPEPASLLMLGIGATVVLGCASRRRGKASANQN